MFAILRWIAFLPAAFIVSLATNWLIGTVGSGLFGQLLGTLIGAWFTSFTFLAIGLWVAPVSSKFLKWGLISIIVVTGLMSIGGSLLGPDFLEKKGFQEGVIFVISGLAYFRANLEQLENK